MLKMVPFLVLIVILTLIIIVALVSGMVLTSLYEVYGNVCIDLYFKKNDKSRLKSSNNFRGLSGVI